MAKSKKQVDTMTQISISLPSALVSVIDEMAAADNRNRSNYIANVLSELAKKIEEQQNESAYNG